MREPIRFIIKLLSSFLFIFYIGNFSSFCQNQDKNRLKDDWYIEPIFRYGRIIPNYSQANLWNIYMNGLDIRVGKQTYGKNEWEQWFHYPTYGLALRYAHFSDVLLQSKIGLFWFMTGSFFDTKYVAFCYQLGSGLIYFYNPYNPTDNKENIFIGSHLNAHIDLDLSLDFRISRQIDLILRGNFSHSSNGAIRFPNYGINPLSAQLALRYHFYPSPERLLSIDTIKTFQAHNSFYFLLAPGFKQSKKKYNYNLNEDKYNNNLTYLTATFQLGYFRQFHPKYRFGGGVDLMYSSELRNFFPKEKQNEWNYFTTATFVSFEFLYNRFVIHTALAIYLSRSADFYEWYYERVGFKVLMGKNKNHALGITLKAHAGMIDYIEWGYNYHFWNWNDKKLRKLKYDYKRRT